MSRETQNTTQTTPKILLLGIHSPYNDIEHIDSYFQEFIHLAQTNELEFDTTLFIKLRQIDSAFFLTKGKLEEVKKLCDEKKIEEVIISEPLTVQQERNLTDFLQCRVFDRTQLILEIFEKSAHSAEGKTQVEIAMLKHQKSRLAGRGIYLSQQSGKIGTRGPGETAKEVAARHLENAMLKLKKQLEKIQTIRDNQRKRRLVNQIPHACLIGYTNAGKSTILNALTKSDTLAENKLFATLDTTTRELYINGLKKGVLSDTVGFIQQLPHQLIEAFKSTLSELEYADLLIHVVDYSNPNWQHHIKVVHTILQELNVDKEMVYVFNKADQKTTQNPAELEKYTPYVITNAKTSEGLDQLKAYLAAWNPHTTHK